MKKNLRKIYIIFIFLFVLYSLITNFNKSYAIYNDEYEVKVEYAKLLDNNPNAYKPGAMSNANTIKETGNKIIGYIQLFGSIVSVITLIVIGIKYMVGSVEEKAEYKKTLKPYLIGAIMVFGITTFLGVISSLTSQIFG